MSSSSHFRESAGKPAAVFSHKRKSSQETFSDKEGVSSGHQSVQGKGESCFRFSDPEEAARTVLEEPRDHLLAEAKPEILKQECKVDTLNNCIREFQRQAHSNRLELESVNCGHGESRREQARPQEELAQREKALRDTRIRNIHDAEELKRAQEMRNQSELGDSRPTGHDGAPKPSSQAGSVEALPRPALEAAERVCEVREESGRSQPTWKRRRLAQCKGAPKMKGKEQRQWKKQRRQSEESRTFRLNSNNDPSRGCLADVITGCTLPDDGLYIGRSKSVPGGARRWDNPWQVNDAALQSQQQAVENCGKMLSSPAGRWLRWRLHGVRSKVLYCREGQPCHGEVIVRAVAEAKSEEEQRGGAPLLLEDFSLCAVGWALKNRLCLSPRRRGLAMPMQEMLKRCSTFSREEELRNLLPFPLFPEPTNAEMELSTTCAQGEPVSPELMQEAAVGCLDVSPQMVGELAVRRSVRSVTREGARRRHFPEHQQQRNRMSKILFAAPSCLVRIGPPFSKPSGSTALERRSRCLSP